MARSNGQIAAFALSVYSADAPSYGQNTSENVERMLTREQLAGSIQLRMYLNANGTFPIIIMLLPL